MVPKMGFDALPLELPDNINEAFLISITLTTNNQIELKRHRVQNLLTCSATNRSAYLGNSQLLGFGLKKVFEAAGVNSHLV